MIRNLKVLGLAVVAVLSMSAVVASSASAVNFTADSYPVTLTGGQTTSHAFTVDTGAKVTCTTASFHGTGKALSATQTIKPTYTGCTAFGFLEVKITGFGHYGEAKTCDYLFYATGLVDLVCEPGADLVIDSPCPVTVEPQTGISKVKYTNQGTGSTKDVLVTAEATNIKYENTGHSFACTLAGQTHFNKTTTNGTYTGTTTLTGETENGAEHVGIDVN